MTLHITESIDARNHTPSVKSAQSGESVIQTTPQSIMPIPKSAKSWFRKVPATIPHQHGLISCGTCPGRLRPQPRLPVLLLPDHSPKPRRNFCLTTRRELWYSIVSCVLVEE